jgi:hypothetical protein
MEIKYFVAAFLLILLTGGGVLAASFSQRIRDILFFLMTAGAVLTERMDVNFLSRAWYRGTTRGLEYSLIDVLALSVLMATLLVPRYRGPRWFWPAGLGCIGVYLLYCAFTVIISEPRIFGLFELSKIVRGILLFLTGAIFVRSARELRLLVLGLVCAVVLEGLLGFRQRWFGGMERVAGSLDHANSLSMYLCLVGPVLAAAATAVFPPWLRRFSLLALGLAACTMMLTLSRAGIPTFGLVVLGTLAWCVSWRLSVKKLTAVAAFLVLAGGVVYASWGPLMERYGTSSLAEEYLDAEAGNEGRGVYIRWARLIATDHAMGLGLNNWSYGVSKSYGAQEGFIYGDYDKIDLQNIALVEDTNFAAPAHSLGALTLGELGVPGLMIFTVLWLRWFQIGVSFLRRRLSDPMHRIGVGIFFGMGGVFLQSQTEWVYRHTPIFITFHLLLGVLAGLFHQRHLQAKRAKRRVGRPQTAPLAAAVPLTGMVAAP